jgi:ABC-2 type transport system ATP-binding protein
MTSGEVLVDGHDIGREYRAARSKVGLVPQEIALDIFATVWNTVRFSRRLFGRHRTTATSKRCCATFRCGRSATAGSSNFRGG